MNWKRVTVIAALLLVGGSALAEDKREQHPHAFARDVDALHAALAPLWHAQPGKERARNVCAQVDRLDGLAREIRSGDTKAMLASISGLKAQCLTTPAKAKWVSFALSRATHQSAVLSAPTLGDQML